VFLKRLGLFSIVVFANKVGGKLPDHFAGLAGRMDAIQRKITGVTAGNKILHGCKVNILLTVRKFC
jgi:hypothetical protein